MRFIYRTLAIVAMAIAAGLTHAWFVPLATSFGSSEPRATRERSGPAETGGEAETPPQPPVDPETPDPVDEQPGEAAPDPGEADPVQTDPVQTDPADPPPVETPPAAAPEEIDIDALGDFIDVAEARAIWRAGHEDFTAFVAFLDARFPQQYAEGHVTGARRLMSHEVTDGSGAATLNWLLEQAPDYVVIYCEGGECDASKNLARQLELSGSFAREQLHVLEAGYPAWAEQYPNLTTSGNEPGQP